MRNLLILSRNSRNYTRKTMKIYILENRNINKKILQKKRKILHKIATKIEEIIAIVRLDVSSNVCKLNDSWDGCYKRRQC